MSSPALEILLLGGFAAHVHGAPLPKLRSRQGVRLLALLALRHDREVEREYLAGLLWPESVEADGLALLRRALTDLRAALGPEGERLETPTRRTLRLNLTGDTSLDHAQFEESARRSDTESLDRAIALYRGPFLEGFTDDWAVTERGRLEQIFLGVLEARAKLARAAGESGIAVPLLRRAILTDPLRESAHRALMESLAESGDYAAVAAAYEALCRRLRRDLDAEPDAATRELYHRLRREGRQPSSIRVRPPLGDAKISPGLTATAAATSSPTPRLPAALTRYFGRERERRWLRELLTEPETRLVTVTGPGGAGKTRIALETARALAADFPGGTFFVPLADLREPERVPETVAAALGIPVKGDADPLNVIIAHLNAGDDRSALLVLDNLEQLVVDEDSAAVTAIGALLEGVPHLTALATSRHALRLGGEREFPLAPLPVPTGQETTPDQLTGVESVALFLDRARSVRPDFALTDRNARAVAELCRHLEGMPLAVEMAAAWARTLTPDQILGRFSRQLDLLTARRRDLPERHQSLRATLEWSYQLLRPPLARFFAALSVFRGGCDLDAAEAVLGDDALERLTELAERSLVVSETTDEGELPRYRLLEVVREFAEEKRAEDAAGEAAVERHAAYFHELTASASPKLTGPEQEYWANRLDRDYENIRTALETLEARADGGPRLLAFCQALARHWVRKSAFKEGVHWLLHALAHPGAQEPSVDRARVLNRLATCYWRLTDYAAARKAAAEAAAYFEAQGQYPGLAEALMTLAHVTYYEGRYDESLPIYEATLEAARKGGELPGIASALGNLGVWHSRRGDAEKAKVYFEEQIALRRPQGDRAGLSVSLFNLGELLNRMGERERAKAMVSEAMAIQRTLGDNLGLSYCLLRLGWMAMEDDDFRGAGMLFRESLSLRAELGLKWETVVAIECLARLAHRTGDPRRAVRLFAAAAAQREVIRSPEMAPDPEQVAQALADCATAFGETIALAGQAEGRALSPEAAVAEALDSGS